MGNYNHPSNLQYTNKNIEIVKRTPCNPLFIEIRKQ